MPLRAVLSDNTKVWIRTALAKLGVEVAAYSGSFAEHRANIINDGKVSTVWDVGAHVGQYGARLISNGYRGRIVSAEPSGASFAASLGGQAGIHNGRSPKLQSQTPSDSQRSMSQPTGRVVRCSV